MGNEKNSAAYKHTYLDSSFFSHTARTLSSSSARSIHIIFIIRYRRSLVGRVLVYDLWRVHRYMLPEQRGLCYAPHTCCVKPSPLYISFHHTYRSSNRTLSPSKCVCLMIWCDDVISSWDCELKKKNTAHTTSSSSTASCHQSSLIRGSIYP